MNIRSRVMSALRWSAAARFGGQLLSWAITIWVIRLLSPGDYGLTAMAMVFIGFFILLNTLGLDAVLVQEKELSEEVRRQIFGVVIVVNTAFFALLFFGAPLIESFYGASGLALIVQVLSLQFLLLIFETLPQSQLERDINFAGRSVVEFVTMVVGSVTTLVLALLDYGVWALVWGTLATTTSRMIGLNIICRNLVWPSFSLRSMRRHLAFGSYVTADRSLWFIFAESDKFIGGKMLGNHLLGYYAVASHLASLPIAKISGILNAIAFPAFSHTHSNDSAQKVRDYLLKSTRMLGTAAFPVFFGMSCTAEPVIAVLLGPKWLPAAPALQILGLVMPFRLLSNVFPPLLWGVGRPRTSATNFLLAAALMPLAFYIGSHWGVIGLAYAWLCMYPLVFLVTAYRSCATVGLGLGAYLSQLLRPVLAAGVMYGAVYAVGHFLVGEPGDWFYLAQLVGVGALVYAGAIFVLDRNGVVDTLDLLRS